MTDLSNLMVDADVEGTNEDFIPGSGSGPLPTGLYPMSVELAYLDKSRNGAACVRLTLKEFDGERRLRIVEYVTSGDAKGNKNYYYANGKKHLLPGMEKMNQLATITTGRQLGQLVPQTKSVKLMNWETRQEELQDVDALTEMIGQNVLVGVVKRRENKAALNDNTGRYEDTNEERVYSEAQKFFYPSGHSVAEKAAGSGPDFRAKWQQKHTSDYVYDTFQEVEGSSPTSTTGSAPSETSAAVKAVFG